MSRKALVCLPSALILLLPMILIQSASMAQVQHAISLPTLIEIAKTAPDLTIPTTRGDVLVGTGDFNGDGATDLLFENVPTPSDFVQGLTGSTIVFGRPGLTASATEAASSANTLNLNLRSLLPNFSQGPLHVEALRDLEGRNLSDIAVTAFSATSLNSVKIDALYIVFGSAQLQPGSTDLHSDVTLFFPDTVKGLRIVGAGDVNADGHRDLVFMTIDEHSSATVNVLLGPFTSGQTVDLRMRDPDVVISEVLGSIVTAALADINGDGVSDILIGRDITAGKGSFGQVDVVLGAAQLKGNLLIQLSNGGADAVITQTSEFTNLIAGFGIAVGDVNGDGIDDILVGGLEDGEDTACVVFGSPAIKGRVVDVSKAGQDVTVNGFSHGGFQYGFGTLLLSDFDGDGIADILVAARAHPLEGGHKFVTAIYGILGSTQLTHGSRVDVSRFEQDLTIIGENPDLPFNLGQLKVDFNGDGAADIVVGNDFDIYHGALSGSGSSPGIFLGGPIRPPAISAASFNHRSLTLTGSNFTGAAQIEVNGALAGSAPVFSPADGTLAAKGKSATLNLHPGANRIVVIRKGVRSGAFQLDL